MSGGYFDRIPPGFYVGPDGRLMADRLFPTTEKESDMTAPKTAPPEFDGEVVDSFVHPSLGRMTFPMLTP